MADSWGLPQSIQVDNGPAFTSKALDDWAHRHRIKRGFSRPGTPTDHPAIEAFNGRFRAECSVRSAWISTGRVLAAGTADQ